MELAIILTPSSPLPSTLQSKTDLTYGDTVKTLRHEELRCENTQETTEAGAAMTASGKQTGKQPETRVCFYCKKPGHIQKDCWHWKKAKKAESKAGGSTEPPTTGKANATFADPDKVLTAHGEHTAPTPDAWYVDSGASNHVTGSKEHFTSYTPVKGQELEVANGFRLHVKGKGDLIVPGTDGLVLQNVWHVPGMASNLVSLGQLEDRGITMAKWQDALALIRAGKAVASIHRLGRLYTLGTYIGASQQNPTLRAAGTAETAELWHRRLGHANYGQLDDISKAVDGMMLKPADSKPFCEPCIYGKQQRRHHGSTN